MNREQLITAMQQTANEKPRSVTINGWGTLYVRALTVAEVDAQSNEPEKKDANGNIVLDNTRLARGAARILCDEHGNRIFDPDNAEDVALLAKQPWKRLRKVLAESDILEGDTAAKN